MKIKEGAGEVMEENCQNLDRQEKPRQGFSGKNLWIILPAAIFLPSLLFNGWLILGGLAQMIVDHGKGPLRLEAPVSVTSPDGRSRFEAAVNGQARLIDLPAGRIRYTRQISPEEFRSIQAMWQGNQQVDVVCYIRYSGMALQKEYLWDRKSGAVTASWSDDVRDFAD